MSANMSVIGDPSRLAVRWAKVRNGGKLLGALFMQRTVSMRQLARPLVTCLLVLIGASAASAADTYNLATRQLTMPTVVIGGATYSNMIVPVGDVISGPTGTIMFE